MISSVMLHDASESSQFEVSKAIACKPFPKQSDKHFVLVREMLRVVSWIDSSCTRNQKLELVTQRGVRAGKANSEMGVGPCFFLRTWRLESLAVCRGLTTP